MYIRALTSGVLNAKILAFSTPNTKKLSTSHVLTFSIDEQLCSISRTIRWNAKKISLFFLLYLSPLAQISLSLSLSLSLCGYPLPLSSPPILGAVDLATNLARRCPCLGYHLPLSQYQPLSLSPFRLSLYFKQTYWFRLGLWVDWFFAWVYYVGLRLILTACWWVMGQSIFFFLRLWWVLGGEDVLCFFFIGGARFI